MVDTLPLALIAVSTLNSIFTIRIFREIVKAVLTDLLEDRTIGIIIKITSNEDLSIGAQPLDRIKRLAQTISHDFTEGTTVALTTITTRQMNHKHMERIARCDLATDIEDIACGTHVLYRIHPY